MFKVLFIIGGLAVTACYFVSKVVREKLERHENPLS